MLISELNAKDLQVLKGTSIPALAVEWSDRDLVQSATYLKERCIDVHHRNLHYVVGCWIGWEGKYWVVECRTGMIFRENSVKDLRDIISLCSASYYEPNEVR